MNRKRARVALAVATATLAGSIVAAASYAATPILKTQFFAKAGPVKMHADLSLTTASAPAKAIGALSSCVVQQASKPRSGVADKIVCKTPSGAKISMPLAPKAATFTYHLAATGSFNLQSATVQIRHKTTVVATLAPAGGSMTFSLDHTAGLVNGRDTLYVQAGSHVYTGKIVQVH